MWTGGVAGWSYYYSDTTMDWTSARAWCQREYTDMVAIQNQEEIAYLNSWLPRQPTYYWIGIRKVDSVWTWVGTNKSLTDEATNWAEKEPNNGRGAQMDGKSEDCVEMYIKRESQAGKWNDEWCDKAKTALCYSGEPSPSERFVLFRHRQTRRDFVHVPHFNIYICFSTPAACKTDSCSHGECVETINSSVCQCFEGFYGAKCEHGKRTPHFGPSLGHARGNCTKSKSASCFVFSFS